MNLIIRMVTLSVQGVIAIHPDVLTVDGVGSEWQ